MSVVALRKKNCPKCGEKKPRTSEYFAKHSTSGDGLSSYCKSCRNEMRKRKGVTNIRLRLKHHIGTRVAKQCQDLPTEYMRDLEKYLGYRITELRVALNADLLAREEISLKEAFTKGYHLDHKYPLSKYAVKHITDEAFRTCWAINNLQMLSAEENLAKGAKVLK